MKETATEKIRNIAAWLNWQDENFNDKFKTLGEIERCYDACLKHDLEFADNLDWESKDDEEYKLACEVNKILGWKYYNVEE